MQEENKRKRVLVVEDEPVICRICERTLSSEGFDIDIAVNGLIAKEMVKDKTYDLCLSDIRTPEMNGIQLYRYLEQEYPELASKVIFTTGDILSNNVDIFLKEVQRLFLPKPFTPAQLKQVIKEHFVKGAVPD
jgi:CheY-like chemotaxis protein